MKIGTAALFLKAKNGPFFVQSRQDTIDLMKACKNETLSGSDVPVMRIKEIREMDNSLCLILSNTELIGLERILVEIMEDQLVISFESTDGTEYWANVS